MTHMGRTTAGGEDGRALRRTRIRLAVWSGAITFVVVVLLGAALFMIVSRQLAQDSEDKLRARAAAVASDPLLTAMGPVAIGAFTVVAEAEQPGLVFGGPSPARSPGLSTQPCWMLSWPTSLPSTRSRACCPSLAQQVKQRRSRRSRSHSTTSRARPSGC